MQEVTQVCVPEFRRTQADAQPELWFRLAITASALLSLPYLLAIHSFFSGDDWVHLFYNGGIPPWQVWRYFSPHAVWFYRPLQAMQFGWLYHLAGVHPAAYNLCLWVMHLGVCSLVFLFARQLTSPRAALLTTILFASQWVYVDVLFWRSNFNTLHWALTTLGMSVLFLRYLDCASRRSLAGVYIVFLLNFLTKESATDAPLLLAALWWWHAGARDEATPWRTRLARGVRLLAPFAVLTLLYVGFHHCLVHDAYQGYNSLNYHFVPPLRGVRQTLYALNHLLLPFHGDPVILPQLPKLARAVGSLFEYVYILPALLAVALWRSRNRVVGLGLLWTLATLVPVTWLPEFHTSRYYYLPAVGASLILAQAARWCWRRASLGSPELTRRWIPLRGLKIALPVALAYLLLVNLSLVILFCLRDREETRLIEQAYNVLRHEEGRIPRGSLVVVKNLPYTCFVNGMGLPEMVRMALHDPTALGVEEGERMPDQWVDRLRQERSVYLLDVGQLPLALRCLRGTPGPAVSAEARPAGRDAP